MAMQARQYEGTVGLVEYYTNVSVTISSTITATFCTPVVVTLPAGSQAAPGDFVQLGVPAALAAFILQGTVTAAGVVTISGYNASSGTVNAGAQLVSFLIERPLPTGN